MLASKVIYEPRGRAREYAPLAVNLFEGTCPYRCGYCYVPGMPGHKPGPYTPRADILERLERDAGVLVGSKTPILLSFTGEPYHWDHDQVTADALLILAEHGLRAVVLTKSPARFWRYARMFQENDWWIGTTLTCADPEKLKRWEAKAPSFTERIGALRLFHDYGVNTWVSLEPIIYPEESLTIIECCHNVVDHWKVGKLNCHKHSGDTQRKLDKITDWGQCAEDVKAKFAEFGVDRTDEKGTFEKGTYYLKESLQRYEDNTAEA